MNDRTTQLATEQQVNKNNTIDNKNNTINDRTTQWTTELHN